MIIYKFMRFICTLSQQCGKLQVGYIVLNMFYMSLKLIISSTLWSKCNY